MEQCCPRSESARSLRGRSSHRQAGYPRCSAVSPVPRGRWRSGSASREIQSWPASACQTRHPAARFMTQGRRPPKRLFSNRPRSSRCGYISAPSRSARWWSHPDCGCRPPASGSAAAHVKPPARVSPSRKPPMPENISTNLIKSTTPYGDICRICKCA